MAAKQFNLNSETIHTLSLLQSIGTQYEYIVDMKENDFTLNFNSLITSNSSSIKKNSFSSIIDMRALIPFFFNNDFVKNIIFKKYTIVILELCVSHFERKIEEFHKFTKGKQIINHNERKVEDLKNSYRNTDILKTFSDSIFEEGYSHIICLPKFGIASKTFPNEENEPHFSFKVKIPITHKQIIRLCLETIQSFKNGSENNCEDGTNDENKLFVKKELMKSIENILNLQQYSDKKTKARYSEHLLSLFYYNAALYISNGGLTEENITLFSATPTNHFALRCYFLTRISYIIPTSYFKELQLFKKLLFDNLKVNNIHRFLIDAWVYRESSHFNLRSPKRPISLCPEENLHFNEHSGPCHLISCSSILEELKNLYTSMNKTERDLIIASSNDSPQNTERNYEIESLKSRLQKICSNILLLYLSLVYGISWKTIKKLTLENIFNLILGFNNFDEAIDLPHIMGLPSIVLRLLGIQQRKQNMFIDLFCGFRSKDKRVLEFGPTIVEEIPPSSNDVLKKDNAFSKGIDKVIKERFIPNGIIAGILHTLKSTYSQNDLSLSKKREIFETYLRNELNKPIAERDQKRDDGKRGDAESKYETNRQNECFSEIYSQRVYLQASPLTCFFTVKESNNHLMFNSIGDIALNAILLYKKYIDADFNKICFTQFRIPHFQNLVKDLVIKDYITHGGFKLPGETDSAAKRLKCDSNLETVVSERKLEYSITHPHLYDYNFANVDEEKNAMVDKKFEKNLSNLMTMKYSIDMLRVTSLNFVMRSLSLMNAYWPIEKRDDEEYKKKVVLRLFNSSLDNYKDLPQTILLKKKFPRTYEKVLHSFKYAKYDDDFMKFFRVCPEQSRFFIHN
ncbi:hypothetical protein Wxf_00034 [Armadillidium vulgare]|nr:hypothetical protein Wxf_00034 [Armadillidium vulgare] [Wolbachia endosymbiont of Armadillidium vulgare]